MDHIDVLLGVLLLLVHLSLCLRSFRLPTLCYWLIEWQRCFSYKFLGFLRFRILILRFSILVERHLVHRLSLFIVRSVLSPHVYVIWINVHLWWHVVVVHYVVGVVVVHIDHVHLSKPGGQRLGDVGGLFVLRGFRISFLLLLLYFV